jgi:hypothetical protein
MGIKRQRADCIAVDYECDVCKEGRMRPTGHILQTDYPQYQHSCTKCEETHYYGQKYPYPTFE